MGDLIERLRNAAKFGGHYAEAADRIEELTHELNDAEAIHKEQWCEIDTLKGEVMQEGLVMKYFVLKPAGRDVHAGASRSAMMAYAQHVEDADILLAVNLREWAMREGMLAFEKQIDDVIN